MTETLSFATMSSPVGRLTLVGEGDALAGVNFENAAVATAPPRRTGSATIGGSRRRQRS